MRDGESVSDEDVVMSSNADTEAALTEEEISAALKYRLLKETEAERIRNYAERLEEAEGGNFKDRPDPIEEVRVIHSYENSVVVEWDRPDDNNEEIVLYNVYVTERKDDSSRDRLYQTEAHPEQSRASLKINGLEPN